MNDKNKSIEELFKIAEKENKKTAIKPRKFERTEDGKLLLVLIIHLIRIGTKMTKPTMSSESELELEFGKVYTAFIVFKDNLNKGKTKAGNSVHISNEIKNEIKLSQ